MKLLLKCRNIAETQTFYRRHLGFDVAATAENTCTVRLGNDSIIFSASDILGAEPHCTGTIYFFHQEIESYYQILQRQQANILWPLQRMSYGTFEFGVQDINGYCLAFAEKEPTCWRRRLTKLYRLIARLQRPTPETDHRQRNQNDAGDV